MAKMQASNKNDWQDLLAKYTNEHGEVDLKALYTAELCPEELKKARGILCGCCTNAYNPGQCPFSEPGFKYAYTTIGNGPIGIGLTFRGCEWNRAPGGVTLFFDRSEGYSVRIPEVHITKMYRHRNDEGYEGYEEWVPSDPR